MRNGEPERATADLLFGRGTGLDGIWPAVRGRLLDPLLARLTRYGLRPVHLTFASLTSGVLFAPAWITGQSWFAVGLLWAHVLLEGMMGRWHDTSILQVNRGVLPPRFVTRLSCRWSPSR